MAAAAWLVWQRAGWTTATGLFLIQLAFNASWPWLFFGLRRPELGLVVILILMDFITFSLDPWFPIVEYPLRFFENRSGIHWMFIALVASYGLDPDCEWMANAMKDLTS